VKKLLLLLLVAGIALAGVAYLFSRPRQIALREDLFSYVRVERGELRETVSGTGTIQLRDILHVSSDSPGTVVAILAQPNDVVTEGEVLLRLDDRRQKLKVQEAREQIELTKAFLLQAQGLEEAARLAWAYQTELESKGGFRAEREQSEVRFRAAQAGVSAAKARLRSAETAASEAQLALDLTEIKVPSVRPPASPKDTAKRKYIVLGRKVELGQLVGPNPGPPLFTLAEDLQHLEVHTEVAEGDMDRVRPGLPASFTIPSSGEEDQCFPATVKQVRLLPASVKGAVYYNVVLEVENRENRATGQLWLRPGMTAAVDIILRQRQETWKVPMAALGFHLEEAYQTPAVKQRLREWQSRPDSSDWKPIWIWSAEHGCPWPVFARLSNAKAGTTAIKDGDYHEVLEWEPGWTPPVDGWRVIIGAPPVQTPGFLDRSTIIKV
jgi:HlyD family secretion protein